MNYSMTYAGVIVFILNALLQHAGISVLPDQVNQALNTGLQVVSAVLILYGRYRAGGVSALGFKSAP